MADSSPTWCLALKCKTYVRHRQTRRKVEPISTWRPCNPVATKKTDPYTLSAIVKGASLYSIAWRSVKIAPRKTVSWRPWIDPFWSPATILWCAHVTVTPEERRNPVFSRGTANGSRACTPTGGQTHPRFGEIDQDLWKKAHKKDRKKKISDTINSTIPIRCALTTADVWYPMNVLSRITSFHHLIIVRTIRKIPNPIRTGDFCLNHFTSPIAVAKAPIDPVKGQGLISTRWKGCRFIFF